MSRKTVAFLLAFLMLPFSAMNAAAGPNDPDLSINEINFSDESPDGGDTITLTAEIANDGGPTGQQPVSTNVSFYWDDNLIGVDSVTVSGGSTEDAVMEWKAVGGSHVINVTVDQEQQVNESNEDNNIALREITVAYPPVLFLDDDSSENNGGYSTETDPYYINSLDNLTDIAYDTIVVEYGEDGPGSDTLNAYDMIIWLVELIYHIPLRKMIEIIFLDFWMMGVQCGLSVRIFCGILTVEMDRAMKETLNMIIWVFHKWIMTPILLK